MTRFKVAALTVVVSGASAIAVSQLLGQIQKPDFVALTIERTQQTLGEAGNIDERVIEAVRAEGSTAQVVQHRSPDGTLREFRRIIDLSSGRRIILASPAKSTTTYFYTEEQVGQLRRGRSCSTGDPEPEAILGYGVVSTTQETNGLPGESFKLVRRYAPALGCMLMDETLKKTGPDGSEQVVKYSQVVKIDLGEPDPALFAVPNDYVEMSPAEYAAKAGGAETAAVQRLESTYRQSQANQRP